MISIRNITKDFGTGPILQNLSLDINDGECVAIIGGSGCGKSTLLRCINRLITPEEGSILINGENILDKKADIDSIRRHMGMVYQHFNLFSHLNVLENIVLAPMKVLGKSREEAEADAKAILERVGMGGREKTMPSALSGGQKQRVAIARTLAMHPDLILFDEPTSALDPTMVDEVESVIRDLVQSGMTCVIVTHEMRFARNIATKVVFLAEKNIYEMGPPEQIFEHPKKLLTQRFLYRSRMYETELSADSLDLYDLASGMKDFLNRFETDKQQFTLVSRICDELIHPVFHAEKAPASHASVRLICSDTGRNHMLNIIFRGIESDPLGEPYLDELNLRLLEFFAGPVLSRKTDDGWSVMFQMK